MHRRLSVGVFLVLLSGVVALGANVAAGAQSDPPPEDVCVQYPEVCQDLVSYPEEEEAIKEGESEFGDGATGELLAVGVVPAASPQSSALAMQRVRIAPGGSIVTPADDPRVVLLYVESGTLTVRNTVATTVTRGVALATPGAQSQEAIPAETEFTMTAGDSSLSPAGSGGELRNDGTEDVILLATLLVPIPTNAATPAAGTPVP
jgi:quercetin dioxygenase-like cupin family protein